MDHVLNLYFTTGSKVPEMLTGHNTSMKDACHPAPAVFVHIIGFLVEYRGLFATHYHRLADAHADDPAASIMHMARHVAKDEAGREQVVIFWAACPVTMSLVASHIRNLVSRHGALCHLTAM